MGRQTLLIFLDAFRRPEADVGLLSYSLWLLHSALCLPKPVLESCDLCVGKNGSMNARSYIDADQKQATSQQEPLQCSRPSPHDGFPVARPNSQLQPDQFYGWTEEKRSTAKSTEWLFLRRRIVLQHLGSCLIKILLALSPALPLCRSSCSRHRATPGHGLRGCTCPGTVALYRSLTYCRWSYCCSCRHHRTNRRPIPDRNPNRC